MRDDRSLVFFLFVANDISSAIIANQATFGLELTADEIDRLSGYYDVVQEQNPVLHLVAPCSAEEFAIRHVLESLTLLKHLPKNAKLADVGAGAGLPSIPCLLVRDDLRGRLVESKERKARFLNEAVERLGIFDRVEVINKQFIETHAADATHVTCRALDKFTELLPRLVRWAKGRPMLLFGGPRLGEVLDAQKVEYTTEHMPLSERRYLYLLIK
jgi:16S rRNA (guanine(527)-N(7))-methyltransferase RsmG